MDEIISRELPTTSHVKERTSDEYPRHDEDSALVDVSTDPPVRRSSSLKANRSVDGARSHKKSHSRTHSLTIHPMRQPMPTHNNVIPTSTTTASPHPATKQGRRGSLPALTVAIKPSKAKDFGSPARSPYFASRLAGSSSLLNSPIPEKGGVSIQIAHPESDLTNFHITNRQETIAKNLSYILCWYIFSTCLSLYNKNLMGKDRFNFNFPLLVSAIHTGLHSIITAVMMAVGGSRWNPRKSGDTVSMHNYIFKVVPCGLAAALEICCANASLVFISLSFYTMVKSSTPIWVLLFALLFGLEKPRILVISIIIVMVIGVILTVEGETKFDMTGFVLVLTASVMSGLRWSLTQLLLQHDSLGMDNPVATLYHLSPVMFVTMATLSLIFEDPIGQFRHSEHFDSAFHVVESFGLMAIGGLLAFAMTLAEFHLIKSTNTITLSVAGISKEVVIITLSVLIYGDVLTPINLLGLAVSIIGIIAYNYYKLSKHGKDQGYEHLPMHGSNKLED
ncbi:hypothetical protein K450DRAFT_258640 [Umbelopsis ramanniana AG]|uniref:Sugar phosphate transporter domain-containing protein n=1 Tax=Umbelopsis ramanniana AG TaxID=1314678 RepID=A0AAD5E3H5_UMBRA|nr:uncharacterized protein K450DRAFT_258640 [Umbelopsis ramanniana AG]KAI8576049.1 hypothetical protein K450DRAFT_258640 [Umbelopsis ramanniana AG]